MNEDGIEWSGTESRNWRADNDDNKCMKLDLSKLKLGAGLKG